MAVLPLFPPQIHNTFLLPCKAFDTDADISFDIYQLCADKHAVTSISCIGDVLVTVRSHEDTI